MKIQQAVIGILILLFGLTPLAVAGEVVHLPEMEVTAKKEVSAEGNVKLISIKEEATPVTSSLPDVLDKVSGLDIQTRSIMTPKSSQVKIRGLDERRSLIMMDGRPLNGTGVMGGQFVDWSVLSLQNIEDVAVGKGAFSAKYGNTLGGTINLIPIEPEEKPSLNAAVGYKRYDTFSTSVAGSVKTGNLGSFISGGYQKTGGHLRNSSAEKKDFSGRFSYDLGDTGKLTSSVRYTNGDFNMPVGNEPGQAGFDPSYPSSIGSYLIGPGIKFPTGDTHGDNSFYTKERVELDLGLEMDWSGFSSQAKIYFNNEDREDTIYSYNQEEVVLKREAVPDRSWGWVARTEKNISEHLVGMGLDGNYQGYGGTDNTYVRTGYFASAVSDGVDDWDATRWHGLYLDDTWSFSQRLELYAGLRYENYFGDRRVDQVTGYNAAGKPAGFETVEAKFDEDALLPKLGLVFRPGSEIALHGRVARATRFPDNPAFYWYYGGYRPEVDPNSDVVRKDLTYEDAMEYEAGVTYTGLPGLTLKLNCYVYQVDDYIRWIFGYAPSRVVYNIDRVNFRGVEIDIQKQIANGFSGFANLTWQETEKEGDVLDGSNALSDELSELPEFKANFGIKYQGENGWEAKATLRWVDNRQVPYLSSGSSEEGTPLGQTVTLKNMEEFTVVDLLVKYPLPKTLGKGYITAGVENLFDENYEEEYGFPNPGQTVFLGLEFSY
ncbi:TonB-dependent receptor [Desulfospira joergensenii]|uniref:TonB-dependent receptor n=1 Tax=Desulfospira joergensenii TaxID=53329 RepID=UPI0013778422|nr:TonB-dependent receptor [Desulfospira joergensenii]